MDKVNIAIIGAGASGLMCASLLANNSKLNISIFDKNLDGAKKLLITGNGRCNVTNLSDVDELLNNIPHNSKFMFSALNNFSAYDMISYLSNNGVDYIVEQNNRVFPKTNKAQTIKDMFESQLKNANNIKLHYGCNVESIEKTNNGFVVKSQGVEEQFNIVVVATGGLSYPLTGSSGDGLKFAKNLGILTTLTRPALCGFRIKNNPFKLLQGVGLNVALSAESNNTSLCNTAGDIMFTNFGVGGPAAFKLSSLIEYHSANGLNLIIDFIPNLTDVELELDIKQFIKQNPKKQLLSLLCSFVNEKVAGVICNFLEVEQNFQIANLNLKHIKDIVNLLKHFKTTIESFDNIERATVTRGGVDIKHINPATMQTKLYDNLFFIGEVLDVDAFSGGYNLQIAFSTAAACAKQIIKIYG
mgnify:CR=1 FL=1